MKILVVGGAGYVGQRVCPHLIYSGHNVFAVDDRRLGNPLPGYPCSEKDLFSLKIGDLEGYHRVIFLAGLSNDPMANYSPAKNYIQNTAAPAYLAYIAKQAGVPRFIFASSASVYGQSPLLMDEAALVHPAYPYGLSKLAAENAVLQLVDSSFQVIALRKGTISGWSPRMRFDLAINAMFKDAVTTGVVTIHNGKIWRPILAMTDAVRAYAAAVEAPTPHSGVFNILSENHDMAYIGSSVARAMECEVVIKEEPEMRNYRMDGRKACWDIGYQPQDGVYEIIRELQVTCGNRPKEWFEQDCFYNIRMML